MNLKLNPVLKACLVPGKFTPLMLKHPLVQEIFYDETQNDRLNRYYEHVRAEVEKAAREHRWDTWIWRHERPWRLPRLWELKTGQYITTAEYRKMLPDVWMDVEFPYQFGLLPLRMFQAAGFVSDVDNVPDSTGLDVGTGRIELWRGTRVGVPPGISWTTDEEKAKWFAKRFTNPGHQPVVRHRFFPLTACYAWLVGRGESEVIVDPRAYIRKENR